MDMITAVVASISVVTAHAGTLLGLWVRLRWRAQYVETQSRLLTQLLRASPGHGHLEVDVQHGPACRSTMTFTAAAGTDAAE